MDLKSLKAKLSEYVDAVRRGEKIIVTDCGRPIARVAPIEGLAGESASEMS